MESDRVVTFKTTKNGTFEARFIVKVKKSYEDEACDRVIDHDQQAKKKKKDKRKKLEKQQSDPEICLCAPISKTPTSCTNHTVS